MISYLPIMSGIPSVALFVRAFQISKLVQVAAELDIAGRLGEEPRPAAELARECGAHPAMLLRMIRALAAFGVFCVDGEGNVTHTDHSRLLRRDADPSLYHAARYWTMASNWAAWNKLEHAVRTGEPAFEALFATNNFDYLRAHPEEARLFDAFMRHSPDDRHAAVAEAYDVSLARRVVDIGGGNGGFLALLLAKYPHLDATLFDREEVIAGAGRLLGSYGARCRMEAGDFFVAVPDGGDVYVLTQILHDWDDERCLRILANCRTAMGCKARLIIVERVLGAPARDHAMNYLADIHMMVLFAGARERTLGEFATLLAGAGFAQPRFIPTRSPFCILESRPA
jgi:O-methyltransferase domain